MANPAVLILNEFCLIGKRLLIFILKFNMLNIKNPPVLSKMTEYLSQKQSSRTEVDLLHNIISAGLTSDNCSR